MTDDSSVMESWNTYLPFLIDICSLDPEGFFVDAALLLIFLPGTNNFNFSLVSKDAGSVTFTEDIMKARAALMMAVHTFNMDVLPMYNFLTKYKSEIDFSSVLGTTQLQSSPETALLTSDTFSIYCSLISFCQNILNLSSLETINHANDATSFAAMMAVAICGFRASDLKTNMLRNDTKVSAENKTNALLDHQQYMLGKQNLSKDAYNSLTTWEGIDLNTAKDCLLQTFCSSISNAANSFLRTIPVGLYWWHVQFYNEDNLGCVGSKWFDLTVDKMDMESCTFALKATSGNKKLTCDVVNMSNGSYDRMDNYNNPFFPDDVQIIKELSHDRYFVAGRFESDKNKSQSMNIFCLNDPKDTLWYELPYQIYMTSRLMQSFNQGLQMGILAKMIASTSGVSNGMMPLEVLRLFINLKPYLPYPEVIFPHGTKLFDGTQNLQGTKNGIPPGNESDLRSNGAIDNRFGTPYLNYNLMNLLPIIQPSLDDPVYGTMTYVASQMKKTAKIDYTAYMSYFNNVVVPFDAGVTPSPAKPNPSPSGKISILDDDEFVSKALKQNRVKSKQPLLSTSSSCSVSQSNDMFSASQTIASKFAAGIDIINPDTMKLDCWDSWGEVNQISGYLNKNEYDRIKDIERVTLDESVVDNISIQLNTIVKNFKLFVDQYIDRRIASGDKNLSVNDKAVLFAGFNGSIDVPINNVLHSLTMSDETSVLPMLSNFAGFNQFGAIGTYTWASCLLMLAYGYAAVVWPFPSKDNVTPFHEILGNRSVHWLATTTAMVNVLKSNKDALMLTSLELSQLKTVQQTWWTLAQKYAPTALENAKNSKLVSDPTSSVEKAIVPSKGTSAPCSCKCPSKQTCSSSSYTIFIIISIILIFSVFIGCIIRRRH